MGNYSKQTEIIYKNRPHLITRMDNEPSSPGVTRDHNGDGEPAQGSSCWPLEIKMMMSKNEYNVSLDKMSNERYIAICDELDRMASTE